MIEGDTISAAADLRDAKEGRPLFFYTGWGASPAGPHPTSSTLQCTPGPLPTHFSHSPDELRPDELRPAVFFFFFFYRTNFVRFLGRGNTGVNDTTTMHPHQFSRKVA